MTAPADSRISNEDIDTLLSAVPKRTINGKPEVQPGATMTVPAFVVDALITELRERRAQAVAPIGYVFELARSVVVKAGAEKRWTDWGPQQFGFTEPRVPEGAIRNLRPVYAATPPAQAAGVTEAVRDVLAERRRHVEVEGWTAEHDDQHQRGEMARAGACYALQYASTRVVSAFSRSILAAVAWLWPWGGEWFKPSSGRRDLVKSAALIIAEIELFDRLSAQDRGE